MTNDIDIYRSAHTLIKQYGADAAIEAAMRADRFLEMGDMDGLSTWKKIIRAVDELLATEAPKGSSLH